MKTKKFLIVSLCVSCVLCTSCSNMNNTTKGGLIGAGSGALLGGVVGKMAGNTAVGAAIGTAVGTGAGVLIGKKMDKVKAETAAAVQAAVVEDVEANKEGNVEKVKVEDVKDQNGYSAVKVTFGSGILFETNKYDLCTAAKNALAKFSTVLTKYPDIDIAIYGHTDVTGNDGINVPLSVNRANSVRNYLESCGIPSNRFRAVEGRGSSDPVASNTTQEGRSQNRRVEIYMYASENMIKAAQTETLQ